MKKDTKGSKLTSCSCSPELLTDMMEEAGLELSRRELIKRATISGG